MTVFKKITTCVSLLFIIVTILLFVWIAQPNETSIIAVSFLIFAEALLASSVLILFDNKKYKNELLLKSGIPVLSIIYLVATLIILLVSGIFGRIIDIILVEVVTLLVVSAITMTLIGFYQHDKKVKIRDSKTSKTDRPKQGNI